MMTPSTVRQLPEIWFGKKVSLSGWLGIIGFRCVLYDKPIGPWSEEQALNAYHRGILVRFPGLVWALEASSRIMYGGLTWEIKGVRVNGVFRRSTVDSHHWMIDEVEELEYLEGSRRRESAPQIITPEYIRQCAQERVESAKRNAIALPELFPVIAVFESEATEW